MQKKNSRGRNQSFDRFQPQLQYVQNQRKEHLNRSAPFKKALWHRGLRFRKNSKVYGHPDIAIKKYRIAIFCDGDFWHGYDWENREKNIKTNRDYWIPKIERNIEKDTEVNFVLRNMGWTVIRVWEHEIRKDLPDTADMIVRIVKEKQRLKDQHPEK